MLIPNKLPPLRFINWRLLGYSTAVAAAGATLIAIEYHNQRRHNHGYGLAHHSRLFFKGHLDSSSSSVGAVGAPSAYMNLLKGATTTSSLDPPQRPDLPFFKLEEIKQHGKGAARIWVTFKQGVYDVTEFAESHPGGDKILLAAGGSVEPFWAIYAQHKTPEVLEILEELRIGSIPEEELKKRSSNHKATDDPFSTDPDRHPTLIVNSQKPFNAETPPSLLVDEFLTPNQLFFVRNHMPVPKTDPSTHTVQVDGLGIKKPISLTTADIQMQYEPVSVTCVVQCAGNRRNDMNDFKKVQGLMWTGTAISNAEWTGARLRDVLLVAGVNENDKRIKHVHFEGADVDATGAHYGASIPFEKAMSPEVVIAYRMNGEEIPRDHGHPLRLVCPGIVGARQVKWLTRIHTSGEESPSHWQRRDYRVFPPSTNLGDPLDWESVVSIQEYPVQSAICLPAPDTPISLERSGGRVEVKGYAWSGGGRGIVRVEVSADGGHTWHPAELRQEAGQDLDKMWAWTLWRAEVKLPEGTAKGDRVELTCKATDRSHNTQPETAAGLWNVRGLLHNAWHRVKCRVEE